MVWNSIVYLSIPGPNRTFGFLIILKLWVSCLISEYAITIMLEQIEKFQYLSLSTP